MPDNTEVKAKLKLDNQASRELQQVAKDFGEVDDASKSATSSAMEWGKQVAAVAVGTHLPNMVRGIKDMGMSFVNTANDAYNTQQSFAGLINIMQQKPWGEARREAEEWYDQLEDVAIRIGQNIDEVTGGFRLMNQVMGASEQQLQANLKVTEDMTAIANVMGMNVEQVASEFGGIVMGQVRVRGQLTQLLAQTGVFGDDMTKASTALRKMGTDEAFKLVSGALGSLADRLSKAEPTFDDLRNSIFNLYHALSEKIGMPIIRTLIPVLKDLKEKVLGSADQMERWGESIGAEVAKWVTGAVSTLEKAFEYLKTHGEELKNDILEAMRTVKSVVDFIIQNKEVIAIAFGAHMAAPRLAAGASAVGGMATAARGAVAAGGGVGGATMAVGRAAASSVGPVLALEAAIVALGVAGLQASALQKETGMTTAETAAHVATAMLGIPGVFLAGASAFEKSDKAADARAKTEAALREAMEGNIDMAERYMEQLREMGDVGEQALSKLQQQIQAQIAMTQELDAQIEVAAAGSNVEPLIAAYNAAVAQNNTGMMKLAANTIANSDHLTQALSTADTKITGGIEGLAQSIDKGAKNFWDILYFASPTAVGGGQFTKSAVKALPTKLKGAGGGGVNIKNAKFEIQQDFRDQDPDRVAVVFQRDLVRAAVRRVQTGRATVFGF